MSTISGNNSQQTSPPPVFPKVTEQDGGKKGSQAQGTSNNDPSSWMVGNSNAWKLALGVLMQEFSKIAQIENKLNQQMHQARAEITSEQAEAAKDQASASIASGAAESASAGFSAATSLYHGVGTGSNAAERVSASNECDRELRSLETQHKVGSLPDQVGRQTAPKMSKEEYEAKRDRIKAKKEDAHAAIHSEHSSREVFTQMHQAVGGIAKSLGGAYASAAQQQAQNTAQLDANMANDMQGVEKSTQDVAAAATSINVGEVAKAAVGR